MALRNFRKAHDKFERSFQRAIARGAEERLKKIEQAAEKGDWRAAAWALEHCFPEDFGKNRIEVSGPDGSPIAGVVAVMLPPKADGNGGLPVVDVPAELAERTNGNGD